VWTELYLEGVAHPERVEHMHIHIKTDFLLPFLHNDHIVVLNPILTNKKNRRARPAVSDKKLR